MRAAVAVVGAVLLLAVVPVAQGHWTVSESSGYGGVAASSEVAPGLPVVGREVEDLRTRRSRTFQRSDGSRVVRVFQRSVHFRDGDGWAPIRNRLERAGDGFENGANRYRLSVPDELGDAPVRVGHGGAWTSFALRGSRDEARAEVDGSQVSFGRALPGVTARWTAQSDSVKEELVLAGRGAPSAYAFDVTASAGLSLSERADGGLEFVDGEGDVAFGVPAPVAFDAAGFEAPAGALDFEVQAAASGWVVALSVDEAWLYATDREFPVTVDPTIDVPSAAGDCHLDGDMTATSFCALPTLEVGWADTHGVPHDHRSLLKFDVDAALPGGAQVTAASLWAYMADRLSGTTPKQVQAHRVLSAWNDGATWLSRSPGVGWGQAGGDFAPQVEASVTAGTAPGWLEWELTSLVDGWVDGTLANEGLMLKDDGAQVDGGLVFASSEAAPQNWPTLEIEYTPPTELGPTHTLSGGLRQPIATGRDLDVTAADAAQGVRSVGVWLDPDLDPSPSEAQEFTEVPCVAGCPADLSESFELPATAGEGRHTILVRSVDGAGNVTKERFFVHVTALRQVDRSRLGLEQWFQYDETETGGGSRLYTNADTGNVVWHSTPIVNPGRGLSTVVNLTYNAHDQGGLLGRSLARGAIVNVGSEAIEGDALPALSYAEAGNGVSLSVSGPTRVNEPLRGALVAAAAEEGTLLEGVEVPSSAAGLEIALTDADGTEHVFTHDGTKWVAPPGLNMRLRRFRDGGTLTAPVADKWALTRPDGLTHFFDTYGFQTATKDRNGNTLTYVYERVNAFDGLACVAGDILGRLVGGASPRLCIQRLTEVIDPAGRSLEIDYRPGGVLEELVPGMTPDLPLTNPTAIGGLAGRIAKLTDHAGREYRLCYDEDGYLVRLDEAVGEGEVRSTRLTYEAPMKALAQVGDDRQLRVVSELDDLDDNGEILDNEVRASTTVWYDESQDTSLPGPNEVRLGRRAVHVIDRADTTKDYAYTPGSPAEFEVSNQIFPHRFGTSVHELDDRGRPVRVTNEVGNATALTWNDAENKPARVTRAAGTTDESASDYAYAPNGTGVLESQTEYPSWPSTSGSRMTDLVWAFGSGQHTSTATGVSDSPGAFVADLDRFENPKPGTGWNFTFDARGNVTHRTDAAGNTAETTYDATGRITSETDELDHVVAFSNFHPTGAPQTVVDQREQTWSYDYDAVGNVLSIVDPRGADRTGAEGNPYTTTLRYDSFDRLLREHVPKVSNPAMSVDPDEDRFITRTRTFDRNGNVLTATDGEGAVTSIAYTRMDLPRQVTEPGGAAGPEVTRYDYDLAERLIHRVGAKNTDPSVLDDAWDPLACEFGDTIEPFAHFTRYCLDDAGRVEAEVRYSSRAGDPEALITSYRYDRRDNLIGEIDPNRNAGRQIEPAIDATLSSPRTTYAYNKVDELVSTSEQPTEAGVPATVWGFGYDANGNQTQIQHPRGSSIVSQLTYDHRDELIASTDPLGHRTCLQRRADGRVIAETSPRGTASAPARCTDGDPQTGYTHFTTKYAYDPAGDLLSRSVPFAPDQYGRTDEQLSGWKVIYERNEVGDPETITDARGNSFSSTFYDGGALRSTDRPSFFQLSGGQLVERPGRSANAARSDESRRPQSSLGQTDFGKVDPESLPGMLPPAGATRFVYDEEMRLIKVRDARERERIVDYDPAGRVISQRWPYKTGTPIEHDFAYDKHGNTTSSIDGENDETTFAYDGFDRQIQRTTPGAHHASLTETPLPRVTRFQYDHNGNQRLRETARGVSTGTAGDFTYESGFDSLDRLAFEESPDGARTSYAYDVASNVIRETRPRGQGLTGEALESFQTRMTYDDADRMTESRQQVQDGSQTIELPTELAYDADDNVIRVEAPGAKFSPQGDITELVTQTVYDGRGMPWKTTVGGPSAERTSIVEYDPSGNLRRAVNPRGVTSGGNAEQVDTGAETAANLADASKNASVHSYDEHDLLLTRRLPWNDGDTRKFRQEFVRSGGNELRRIVSILSPHEVTDETVPRTSYTYFDTDWIASVSDQKLTDPDTSQRIESRLISYDYDRRGAQVEWQSKNAGETSAGRHITRTLWPSGQLRSRTARKVTDPDEPASRRRYEYFYNRNGSLVRFIDENKNRTTTIDRDNVERQSVVDETWASGKDTAHAYDLAGNVLTRRTDGEAGSGGGFTGPDARTTTFDYDSLDRETRMEVDPATGANRVTTTNLWPSGRRESRVKPNGTTERWFFNTRGEISRFERQRDGDGGLARETDYAYDPNGNRDQDERGTHVFNARDQLTRWTKDGGRTTEYDLNGDGATTSRTVRSSPGGTIIEQTSFVYRGERLRWAQTEDVRAYYRYDDFGNVVRIKQQPRVGGVFPPISDNAPQGSGCEEIPSDVGSDETYYCHDEFERLRLSRGQGISDPERLDYDGLDRRDNRQVTTSSGTRTRDLSYVGTSELLSREVDDDGAKRFYDYDSAGDRQGQQVTTSSSNRYRAYTKDANGSVLGLEGDDGTVATDARYEYDPYGELDPAVPVGTEGDDNPFRYEGFYFDSGVRTYDMHARHYRPEVGRFLTQDRFAAAGEDLLLQADPLTQNRYAFAGANPVNNVEFDGHEPPTSYDRNASQPIKNVRDPTPDHLRDASNDGPDMFYQRHTDRSQSGESLSSYGSVDRPSDAIGVANSRAPGANLPYACQACPSPATRKELKPHTDRGFVAGFADGASDTWDAATHPKRTAEGLIWAAQNPKAAGQAILDTCDDRGVGDCAGYGVFSALGAKGAISSTRAALRAAKGDRSHAGSGTDVVHQSFPPHEGFFMGWRRAETLSAGKRIDRFGRGTGRFFSPAGTPFAKRGLPPSARVDRMRTYEVVKDLPVEAGLVEPVFGPGLGIQYKTTVGADKLIDEGYLREVIR